MLYTRGVLPCNTAGSNAHNQIGPWTTAACFKLYGLDSSLASHGRLAIVFKNLDLPRATKLQLPGHGLHTPAVYKHRVYCCSEPLILLPSCPELNLISGRIDYEKKSNIPCHCCLVLFSCTRNLTDRWPHAVLLQRGLLDHERHAGDQSQSEPRSPYAS